MSVSVCTALLGLFGRASLYSRLIHCSHSFFLEEVQLGQRRRMRTRRFHQWLLLPALFIAITVLSFNFLGDAFRDAADPYAE